MGKGQNKKDIFIYKNNFGILKVKLKQIKQVYKVLQGILLAFSLELRVQNIGKDI